jgi:hypothetical protein
MFSSATLLQGSARADLLGLGPMPVPAKLGITGPVDEIPNAWYRSPMQKTSLELNADWWSGNEANVGAFSALLHLVLVRRFIVNFEVPWAVGTIQENPHLQTGTGDIGGGLGGIGNVSENSVLWGFLSLRFPTITNTEHPGDLDRAAMLTFASMARDMYDFDRLFPELGSLGFNYGLELRFAKYFHFRGQLSMIIGFPMGADTTSVSAAFTFQQYNELEARFPFGLIIGARFQFVITSLSGWDLSGGSAGAGVYLGYEPSGGGPFVRISCFTGSDPLTSPFQNGQAFYGLRMGFRL